MKEIFKPIKGFEGLYEISNHGRVYSVVRKSERKRQGGETFLRSEGGKFLSQSFDSHGYLHVCLYNNRLKKQKCIHRLVAETFITNKNNKPQVNHIDGNKENNHVDNLEWVTSSEDAIHSERVLGRQRGHRILCPEKVREIRKLRAGGMLMKDIGEEFGVHESTISNVLNGNRWGSVQ